MINESLLPRMEERPVRTKKLEDQWGINAALGQIKTEYQVIDDYSPYYDKKLGISILTAEFTEQNCFLLLKNGLVLMLKEDENLFKKEIEKNRSTLIPIQVKCPIKIVDISCGLKHTLGRGKDCKVYSWGYNTHGQLGTPKFDGNTEIRDPYMVTDVIGKLKVIQVYARGYTSYVITDNQEEKTVYGFGNNERFEICAYSANKPENQTLKTPQKMLDPNKRDFIIYLKKRTAKIIIAEINFSLKTIAESLDIPIKREHCNEEVKLLQEIKNLQEKVNQLRKVRTSIEDFTALYYDIQSLIVKRKEKANRLNQEKKIGQDEANPVKSYQKQINYLQSLKGKMETYNKQFDVHLDDRSQRRRNKEVGQNETVIEEVKDKVKEEEKTENVKLFTKDMLGMPELIEIVNRELEVQMNKVLENYHRIHDAESKTSKKSKRNQDDIKLFSVVQEIINQRIEKILNKDTLEEAERVKEQVLQEYPTFTSNTLKELSKYDEDLSDIDQSSLQVNLKVSTENLSNLDEKIKNLQIRTEKNKIGKAVISMFNKNIELARQNNNMMGLILNLSNGFYHASFNKVISNANPPEFLKIKSVVDEIKKKEVNQLEAGQDLKDTITELDSDDENN